MTATPGLTPSAAALLVVVTAMLAMGILHSMAGNSIAPAQPVKIDFSSPAASSTGPAAEPLFPGQSEP